MRFGPDDTLWVVTDPTCESEVGDILFEASLRKLDLQFKGGLDIERNVTLFTEKSEAEGGVRPPPSEAGKTLVDSLVTLRKELRNELGRRCAG